MDILECIKTRRSIRKFKSTPIPQEIIDDILECGIKAPSGCNTQPWSFIVIKDRNTIERLSQVQKYSSFVSEAPVCIVACLTKEKINFAPSNYLSIACAVENMLLSIHSHGLGSCWTYVKDFDDSIPEKKVRKILDIPKDVEVICMMPIGYPDEMITGRKLKDIKDIVHKEKW